MIIDLPGTTTGAINRRLVSAREEGGAVALGRVLTLIIDAADQDPEEAVAAANAASHEHPCRILVVRSQQDAPQSRLDAQIRLGGDAGASEVVLLQPSGPLPQDLDTLVIALLLPDAPIVTWWPFEAPTTPSAHPLGVMSQRRITDSTRSADPIGTLRRIGASYSPGDTDLAWTRATLWRGLIAATLDQPPYEPVLHATVSGDAVHPSLDLIGAWLAYKLQCPVTVNRVPGAPALTQIKLERPSGDIVLERPDGRTASLSQPGHPQHQLALPIRQLTECLVEELRRLDADEVYGEVITTGLNLLDNR